MDTISNNQMSDYVTKRTVYFITTNSNMGTVAPTYATTIMEGNNAIN